MNKEKIKSYEFEGNTVDVAINLALLKLSVSRENILVKVLSEEKKGLFGMECATPAKIKVTLK